MYDFLLLLYQGQYANATFLQILNAESVTLERTQFGEIGRAKYVLNAWTEDLTNVVAPNRVDAYIFRDTLAQSAAINATSITVHDGTRFKVGQTIALYDGIHYDLASITAITGNALTINQGPTNAYALGASVLRLVHTGRISAVDADVNRQQLQNVETQSYFQELADFVTEININNYECGWVLYNVLQKYASSLDLVINQSNFVMDSTGTGTGGTGVMYTATNGETPLLSLIQEVVKTANGNSSNKTYNLWVDEMNVLHFGQVQTTTPTVTYNIASYTASSTGDALFDVVVNHVTHDQDLTTIKNTYKLLGGKDSSGAPVTARIFDQNSVNQYGQKEAVITNPTLTSVDALTAWGTAQLNATAYPARQYTTDVEPCVTLVSCQDYVSVTGFTDSHTENYTPLSVEITWKAETPGQFHQRITGAELLPDINRVMKAIAAEHYIPVVGVTSGGVNLTDRFVQNGLQGSYTSGSNVFSVTAGTMNANIIVSGTPTLTEFDIPAFSFTVPTDDTYTVAFLYRKLDGTIITSPTMVTFQGLTVPQGQGYTDYQIVPFWTVTRLGGVITHGVDRRNMGGINGPNINAGSIGNKQLQPNPNLSTPPALASGTTVSAPVYPVSGGGSYDAAVTFTLSTTNPNWLSEVRCYAVVAGGSYASQRAFKGDLTPTSNGTYTAVFSGLSSGQAFDLYVCFVDNQSMESPGFKLATTSAQQLQVQSGNLPSMPSNITPNLTSGTVTFAYPSVGNATYDAQTSLTVDSNGTTSSGWCETIELVAQPSNNTNNWDIYNDLPANVSGTYNCVWGGLGAGGTYTLGIRYRDFKGIRSNVLVLGTTVANPVQGPAIAAGSVDTSKTTGIFDGSGQLLYSKNAPGVQTAITSTGNVQAGQLTGTVPYGANSGQVTNVVGQTSQAGTSGNTYLNNSAVSTNQVQSVSIISTQLAQNRYDTSTSNTRSSASYQWYNEATSAYLATNGTISNNQAITYDVGTATDTTTAAPATNTYTLAANASALLKFKHNAFKTGGIGNINVNFTGNSVSQASPVANSPTVSGSDQPSITHTTTDHYQNDLMQYNFAANPETSTANITKTQNQQTYTLTQHNSGDVASGTETATITQSTTYTQHTNSIPSPANVYVGVQNSTTNTSANAGCDKTTYTYDRSSNANIGVYEMSSTNVICDASHPITLNYTLPSSVSFTSGSVGSNEISHYNPTLKEYTYTCSASIDNRTYPSFGLTWNVWLYNPDGTLVQSWTGLSGTSSVTATAGSGQVGTYTWKFQPQWTSDSSSGAILGANVTVGVSGSTVDYSPTTSYTSNNSGWVTLYTTPAGMVAPTTTGTQLTWHSNVVTNASDTHGAAQMQVQIVRSSDGTVVKDCGYVAANTDYTYYNASEAGTQFYVRAAAIVTTNNNNGTGSYACSTDGYFYWYNNDANAITYSYPTTNGATYQTMTDNNSNIVAPTTTGTQVGVYISSLTAASDSYGAATLYMDVIAPNGSTLVSGQPITATGTYGYSNSGAAAGQYKFNLYSKISTNNNNAPGSQNYQVSYYGYAFDYNNVNHPITTYANNSGTVAQYLTASSTVAPTATTQDLVFNLTSVTAQGTSSSYGSNYVCVQLQDPTGTYLTFQQSTDGGTTWTNVGTNSTLAPNGHPVGYSSSAIMYRYYDAAQTHTGVYTWTVYGMVANNGTGDAQYSNSWSGSQTYYTPGASGGNTYVLASDGTTQRLAANDSDINFQQTTPDTLSFKVYNNAAQAVTFTIGIDCKGV